MVYVICLNKMAQRSRVAATAVKQWSQYGSLGDSISGRDMVPGLRDRSAPKFCFYHGKRTINDDDGDPQILKNGEGGTNCCLKQKH